MNKQDVLRYLDGVNGKNIRLGLENITALTQKIGNPEDELKIIHITGTNGKGSVCAFISSILKESGYKVGCFNTPYLNEPNECVRINDERITDEDLIRYMERLEPSIKKQLEEGLGASGFEIFTALTLMYFKDKNVDFVILEAGLGGTLDATNVIKRSIASVITKISVDHKDFLGNTVGEIAVHKAGIIKKGGLVITPLQSDEVMAPIKAKCAELGGTLACMQPEQLEILQVSDKGTSFKYQDESYQIGLIGAHQAYNCALAIEVVNQLAMQKLINVSQEDIKTAVRKTKWAGRFEKIADMPKTFIDGGHNVDGIMALADTIEHLEKCYTIGIVGVLKDKEIDEMLNIICSKFDVLIAVRPNSIRALDENSLAEKIKAHGIKTYAIADVKEAARKAISLAKEQKNAQIIGFGSLYMIGEIKDAYEHL